MSQTRGAACALAIVTILVCPGVWAQDAKSTGDAAGRMIIGLPDIKHNAKGTLTVQNGSLHFSRGKGKTDSTIPVNSIDNVFTGEEVTQAGGVPATIGKMAVPYGGGRVLSLLLRSKVDVLTIAYRDGNHGLHGAIFALPKGQAAVLLQSLTAAGAHVEALGAGEAKPLQSAAATTGAKRTKLAATPIQIERVEVGDIALPAEFRLAIYEYLVENVTKSGTFPKVYRSGDREAEGVANLVTARTQVEKYQAGSETKRELTTVGGFTKVDVAETVSSKDGQVMVQKKLEGRVRFYGDNLHVTNDLAARIAKLLSASF